MASWGKHGLAAGELLPKGKEAQLRLTSSFSRDLVRLDMALSLLHSHPILSLKVIESLEDDFWKALAYTAMRGSFPFLPKDPDPEGIQARLEELMRNGRTEWAEAAVRIAPSDPSIARISLSRLAQVCERMDTVALLIMQTKKESRRHWVDFLPLSLAVAGRAWQGVDAGKAADAFRRSVELASQMESPAREWALCWNAAVWYDSSKNEDSIAAARDAAQRVVGIKEHRPWQLDLHELVARVARFDPVAALSLARSSAAEPVRVYALLAIATALER